MAKLRGEISRLEIRTSADAADPEVWVNIAGQMSTGVTFNAGTDVVNTIDNTSGASTYILTTANGTIEMNAKYPATILTGDDAGDKAVKKKGDLVYEDFFDYSKEKTKIPARFNTPLFTISMVLTVLSLDLNASNSASTDYSVSFGYVEKPKFTRIKD